MNSAPKADWFLFAYGGGPVGRRFAHRAGNAARQTRFKRAFSLKSASKTDSSFRLKSHT